MEVTKLLEVRRIIEESDIRVKSDSKEALRKALKSIEANRRLLKAYLMDHPLFLYSLTPVPAEPNAPEVVKRMAEASARANVGPMASVAGALADLALEEMVESGAKVAVVENGGEVAVNSTVEVKVAVNAGPSPLSKKIGFLILPEDCPIGVGTSSAAGRALTFGEADAATVIAESAALADAAATAACNAVKGRSARNAVEMGLRAAQRVKGVRGALIVKGGHVGLYGRIPKLLSIG